MNFKCWGWCSFRKCGCHYYNKSLFFATTDDLIMWRPSYQLFCSLLNGCAESSRFPGDSSSWPCSRKMNEMNYWPLKGVISPMTPISVVLISEKPQSSARPGSRFDADSKWRLEASIVCHTDDLFALFWHLAVCSVWLHSGCLDLRRLNVFWCRCLGEFCDLLLMIAGQIIPLSWTLTTIKKVLCTDETRSFPFDSRRLRFVDCSCVCRWLQRWMVQRRLRRQTMCESEASFKKGFYRYCWVE